MSHKRAVQGISTKRFRWLALAATGMLGAIAFSTTPARADIIYRFGSNGGDFAVGSLRVRSSVLVSGVITPSDIISFNFQMGPGVGIGDRFGSVPYSSLSIPVSRTDGGFTGPVGTSISEIGPIGAGQVNTDLNYQVIGGESWVGDFIGTPTRPSGVGNWSVTLIDVPESSPMILSVIGLACACGFRAVWRGSGESG